MLLRQRARRARLLIDRHVAANAGRNAHGLFVRRWRHGVRTDRFL